MSRSRKVRGVTLLGEGQYRVRVRAVDPQTGKEVSRFETLEGVTRDAAVARKREMREELLAELRGEQAPERQTFKTYATGWLDSMLPNLAEATAKRYAEALDLHIVPTFGEQFLDEVRAQDVRAWQASALATPSARTKKPPSPETVAGWRRVLNTILATAAREGAIPGNPVAAVVPIRDRRPPKERGALTPEQMGRVLRLAREHEPQHYAFLATLALTGARHGEVAALRWEDVDEEAGLIRIRRSATRGRVGATKTRKARTVGLAPELRAILRAQRVKLMRDQHPGFAAGWVFPVLGKKPADAPASAERPVTLRYHTALAKPLKRLAKLAEIDRHVTVHDLRRSNVDALRRLGTDAVIEHAMVGHSSDRMREHYSTVGHDERRAVAGGVARLVLGASNGSETGVEGAEAVTGGPAAEEVQRSEN